MNLVYINKVGQNWKGNFIYEFLFSDILEDIDDPRYHLAANPEDFPKPLGEYKF